MNLSDTIYMEMNIYVRYIEDKNKAIERVHICTRFQTAGYENCEGEGLFGYFGVHGFFKSGLFFVDRM